MNWHGYRPPPPRCAICGWPLDQTAIRNPHGRVHRQCGYPHNPANMWPVAAVIVIVGFIAIALLGGAR